MSAPRLTRCRGLSSVLASLTLVARRTATNHKRRRHRRGRASIHGSCPSRRRAVQIQKTDHHALQPTRRRDSHAALADRTPARSAQAHGGARQADRQANRAESGTASRELERAMLTHTHTHTHMHMHTVLAASGVSKQASRASADRPHVPEALSSSSSSCPVRTAPSQSRAVRGRRGVITLGGDAGAAKRAGRKGEKRQRGDARD